MTPDELSTYQTLLKELGEARDFTKAGDFNALLLGAETVNASLVFLADALIRFEQDYRKKLLEAEEAGSSHAKAENSAKLTDEYRKYKKLQIVYDRAEEHLKLLKKASDILNQEYRRT